MDNKNEETKVAAGSCLRKIQPFVARCVLAGQGGWPITLLTTTTTTMLMSGEEQCVPTRGVNSNKDDNDSSMLTKI